MKHFRRHTNPNPRDPVPLIRDFFRQAKDQRSHSQLLTSRDYATIREILKLAAIAVSTVRALPIYS